MSTLLAFVAQTQSPQGSPGTVFLLPALLVGMLVFIFLSNRSAEKRKTRERDAMFARLAKNDRVLTIGGIIGTVHTMKDKEVVLKVDESTNTKMTFLKTAIQQIITDEKALVEEKK